METELYKKHRPKTLKDVVGQDRVVGLLQKKIESNRIPHALLLIGPSGVGKTTIARCLRKPIKCHVREFREYDIGQVGGIDEIRSIRKDTQRLPLYGQNKVYFLDEVAQAKSIAQDGMLKMLEESPDYVYFIFATTDPQRLKKTVRSRFMEIPLKPLVDTALEKIIENIATEEELTISPEVISKIVSDSQQSARQGIELLEKIMESEDEDTMLKILEDSSQEQQAVELCRLLLKNAPWGKISSMLKELKGQDVEGLRRMMLGYMRSCLLTGGNISRRAYYIMTCFERNFFDTGHAGLAMACWESVSKK